MTSPAPRRLKELHADAVRAAIADRPWLLIPVGTCEYHGPHLPLGCDTLVVEALADRLSADLGIVRAPTIEFGVNDRDGDGAASVRRKTLRRWLNDLLVDWEQQGITDFLILTMNGHAPHTEALGTVVTLRARVRMVDILALDLAPFVTHPEGPIHGGEADTSLVLHVAPHLVDMARARDCILPEATLRRYRRGSSPALPATADGSIGHATRASAETGRRIFEHIVARIKTRVYGLNATPEEG